ncbi:hypothetical protein [Vibrio nitrifigilis]|uniref:Uncharacterized protein n=1 Tax=Vibrio nitrifigilis TaxID=2789781 RepID=A0ABS0GD90_9VIBR|nr:hypothetical protein [Vibrio nitrifigilis]MBF9000386.1 hypothetical protein [Vibrio nitrifigilis]
MPIEYKTRVAHLIDSVAVEEAQELFEWIENTPASSINLKRCSHLHTSVLQTLMYEKPKITALPTDPLLLSWLVAADIVSQGD